MQNYYEKQEGRKNENKQCLHSENIRVLIQLYVDQMLTQQKKQTLEKHLKLCKSCYICYIETINLKANLAKVSQKVPEGFELDWKKKIDFLNNHKSIKHHRKISFKKILITFAPIAASFFLLFAIKNQNKNKIAAAQKQQSYNVFQNQAQTNKKPKTIKVEQINKKQSARALESEKEETVFFVSFAAKHEKAETEITKALAYIDVLYEAGENDSIEMNTQTLEKTIERLSKNGCEVSVIPALQDENNLETQLVVCVDKF